jgi:hypothetical protein
MPIASHLPSILALASIACLLTGCSNRPARVVAPQIDPQAITDAVFKVADRDRDGSLRAAEQQAVPSIGMAAGRLDADGDKAVTREELLAWLDATRDSRVAITSLAVVLTHRGRPLKTATVRLVPEPFIGAEVQVAEGVTDTDGSAAMSIADAKYAGVHCGLYRVEITGTGNDGKPLPERVNAATTLGVAVGAGVPDTGWAEFRLD